MWLEGNKCCGESKESVAFSADSELIERKGPSGLVVPYENLLEYRGNVRAVAY